MTIVLSGNLTEAKQKKVLGEFEATLASLEGKVNKTEKWGKRELTYPIKKQDTGTYLFFYITIPSQNSGKLKRSLEVNDEVLRHLLVVSETQSAKQQIKRQKAKGKSTSKKSKV